MAIAKTGGYRTPASQIPSDYHEAGLAGSLPNPSLVQLLCHQCPYLRLISMIMISECSQTHVCLISRPRVKLCVSPTMLQAAQPVTLRAIYISLFLSATVRSGGKNYMKGFLSGFSIYQHP